VLIPKGMNVIVDSDQVGPLRAVVVEGQLIFKPHPSNLEHV